jgi:hypothetical protein
MWRTDQYGLVPALVLVKLEPFGCFPYFSEDLPAGNGGFIDNDTFLVDAEGIVLCVGQACHDGVSNAPQAL